MALFRGFKLMELQKQRLFSRQFSGAMLVSGRVNVLFWVVPLPRLLVTRTIVTLIGDRRSPIKYVLASWEGVSHKPLCPKKQLLDPPKRGER